MKELYAALHTQNTGIKIGFSKFCSLRPKWCVLAGSPRTKSVCVCTIHQNVTLLLDAVNLEKDRRQLIDMVVCKECMIHRCINCPSRSDSEDYLNEQLLPEFVEETIEFYQWTSTDRSELLRQCLSLNEFILLLVEKLNELTSHSFIAKAQSKYLKHCKENLKDDEAVVLLDFAENYRFVIQDEIQTYHWKQQSCSLHPVVKYFRSNGILTEKSLCFISDDLNHDTSFMYHVVKETISIIKQSIPAAISKIFYFSGGCAAQYKNCKKLCECLQSLKRFWHRMQLVLFCNKSWQVPL